MIPPGFKISRRLHLATLCSALSLPALWGKEPEPDKPAPQSYRVRVETTKGSFIMEANRNLAPHGADRFYHLVSAGYYNDSRFFRVISGRFAQFGIAGKPAVSVVWRNAHIVSDPDRASNERGTFGFAMVTPDARTTQI
jgi:peptidyl-prolyl cis-trans isomerase A (cyclophilin A)